MTQLNRTQGQKLPRVPRKQRFTTKLPRFQARPAEIAELRPRSDLLAARSGKYLELSWWPFIGHVHPVDLRASDSAVVPLEGPKRHFTLIEFCFGVRTLSAKKCRLLEARCEVRFQLTEDPDGTMPLNVRESPTIAGVWPPPKLSAPATITREVKRNGKFSCKLTKRMGVEFGHEKADTEEFLRVVPAFDWSVGGEAKNPRKVRFTYRATDDFPILDGQHQGGIWLSHDRPCFVLVSARIICQAKIKDLLDTVWVWTEMEMDPFVPSTTRIFALGSQSPT